MLPDTYRLAAAMMIGTDQDRVDALLRAVEARLNGGYREGAESIRAIAAEHGVAKSVVADDVRRFFGILEWSARAMSPPVDLRELTGASGARKGCG